MDSPQIQSEAYSNAQPAVRHAGECVYQFAIILAALLMIISVSMF